MEALALTMKQWILSVNKDGQQFFPCKKVAILIDYTYNSGSCPSTGGSDKQRL